MRLRFLRAAAEDYEDALRHYHGIEVELGQRFEHEVVQTVERVCEYPRAYARQSRRTRRALVNVFPYALYFQLRDDEILVTAVFRQNRDPRRWRARER